MTHKFTEYTNSQCKPNYLIIEFGESDRFLPLEVLTLSNDEKGI